MFSSPSPPLRLTIDLDALAANWRWLARRSAPAACGAAVKADGYGVGAKAVVERLAREGTRDFFVATWCEAAALQPFPEDLTLHVLHGLRPTDVPLAVELNAIPVLNSPEQVALWREAAPGRLCDVMVDTGMNRLGLTPDEAAFATEGLAVDTLHSHLASADEPESPMNARQLDRFRQVASAVPARRRALANSAGICLGPDYHFELTRPGLALYGGTPHPAAEGHLAQVVRAEAELLQLRSVSPGESIGYGGTFVVPGPMRIAILNLGYADGYLRGFSNRGRALLNGQPCPVLGRVSMDLIAIDVSQAPAAAVGDWIEVDLALPEASAASGLSQYEILTSLGHRYNRRYRSS